MRKIPLEFSLYDNVYGGSLPDDQYYVILFDAIPSKYSTRNIYSTSLIDEMKKIGFIEECRLMTSKRNFDKSNESLYVNKNLHIIMNVQCDTSRSPDLITTEFLYNIQLGELFQQIDINILKNHQKTLKKSSIQLVKSDMGHLDTEEYDLTIPELDLELNYGKDFIKIHNTIVKRLNTNGDKGIILLHGAPGSGKTTFLKYLTREIKDKNILFIPPSMAEMLSEPSIIPFLMDNRNSILLIEDAEKVIADREGKGSPAGVSNLLNLTDGILGDCLNIQVIATFNMKRERIDPALLRKGRLLCEWHFKELSIGDSNILLKKIFPGENYTTNKPMLLSDIYGFEDDDFSIKRDEVIGFK
jgi:hypothetical protein